MLNLWKLEDKSAFSINLYTCTFNETNYCDDKIRYVYWVIWLQILCCWPALKYCDHCCIVQEQKSSCILLSMLSVHWRRHLQCDPDQERTKIFTVPWVKVDLILRTVKWSVTLSHCKFLIRSSCECTIYIIESVVTIDYYYYYYLALLTIFKDNQHFIYKYYHSVHNIIIYAIHKSFQIVCNLIQVSKIISCILII